jgi:hypothetical protein
MAPAIALITEKKIARLIKPWEPLKLTEEALKPVENKK